MCRCLNGTRRTTAWKKKEEMRKQSKIQIRKGHLFCGIVGR
jgi:hypothetical protein